MTEHPPNLAAALATVQTKLPRISKSEKADTGKYSYTYAGLADISAQVLPLLGEVGLAFSATPTFDDSGRYILACTLMHVSGETREGIYLLPTGGNPQALGSAITYGRRYLLCAMTGVAPEEDDDGAAAEAAAQQQKQQQRTAQRANQPANTQPQQASSRTTRTRRPAPAEPPLPGEEEPTQKADTAEDNTELPTDNEQATRQQQSKMHTQLSKLDLATREAKLATVGTLVGRAITSSNDLTRADASQVIDSLERVLADDDPQSALETELAQAQDQ